MLVNFTKMHGLGNDFVILDQLSQPLRITPGLIRQIAHRHFGIGCNQVLIVEAPLYPENDFFYRIFNADGQEAEQCGNGVRCFARYVRDQQLTNKSLITVETIVGTIEISVEDDHRIAVNMGKPIFEAHKIPTTAPLDAWGQTTLDLFGRARSARILSVGNPHCIFELPKIQNIKVSRIGRTLQQHPAFPNGVNVSFMQVLEQHHLRLRVYERGVGETLACGSAACAAVVSGILSGTLQSPVQVEMPGGTLTVEWPSLNDPLFLIGPATTVFSGQFAVANHDC